MVEGEEVAQKMEGKDINEEIFYLRLMFVIKTNWPCSWRVTLSDAPLRPSWHTITVPLVVAEAVVLSVDWRMKNPPLPGTGSAWVRTTWNVTPPNIAVLLSRSDGMNPTWWKAQLFTPTPHHNPLCRWRSQCPGDTPLGLQWRHQHSQHLHSTYGLLWAL